MTSFMGLEGFGGDFEEGVYCLWRGVPKDI